MKIARKAFVALLLVLLAIAGGRYALFSSAEPSGLPQPLQEQDEMTPEFAAMLKAGTPGEHHVYLNPMVGEWEGTFTMWMKPGDPPMKSTGTIKREWIFDGRFIKEEVEATADFGTFYGFGLIGYNNLDGQYEVVWVDSTSTAIYTETGTFNPETKILTTRGSMRDPASGRIVNSRGVYDLSNPNRHTFSAYSVDERGREFKSMEGVAERKKK